MKQQSQSTKPAWQGVTASIKPALRSLKYNQPFLSLYLIISLIGSVLSYLIRAKTSSPLENFPTTMRVTASSEVLSVILLVISLSLASPFAVYIIYTASGRERTVRELFKEGFSKLLPVIGVLLLIFIVVGVASIFLVVPGIILFVRLIFSIYIVLDKQLGPIEAMKESFRLTKGNYTKIIAFILIYILITFIGVLIADAIPILGELLGTFSTIPLFIIGYWMYSYADGRVGQGTAAIKPRTSSGWKLPTN